VAIRDALLISLVGISVVFFGLLLTSWLISAIAMVPAWLQRRRQRRVPPPPFPAARENAPLVAIPAPSADAAAVIAALLEVEMRLHGGEPPRRFTFRRDPQLRGWGGEGVRGDSKPATRGVR
jgi:Na+-transporting methylmalonyl-CoA/oxaloacetate decarboxylase gamma subunit